MDYLEEKEFAINLAKRAGSILLRRYGQQNSPKWETLTNFKIAVDKEVDMFIRAEISKAFPKDDIFSEEQDPLNRGQERKWVYDPLDGTMPFTTHTSDNFSVTIAFVKGKKPVVGAVNFPKRGELYAAVDGQGAFCNGFLIEVSDQRDINKSMIYIEDGKSTPSFRRDSMAPYWQKAAAPEGTTYFVRYGCASAGLCQVASGKPNAQLPLVGRLDAFFAGSLEPWDMAAAACIIREAGGLVTTLTGKEWVLGDASIAAANPTLYSILFDYFRK